MLKITDLIIEYADGTRAIDNVSFSVEAGENVALIGANGAGKTSLLLAIVGVLPEKSGEVRVGETGLDKKNLRAVREKVGLVFQNPDDQLFMPDIFEDVAFGPKSAGLSEAETEARVKTTLSQLRIEHLSKRSPLKLSYGEKRLAAIATVLSMKPDFLLFDEPTAFLDPRARRNLKAVLSGLPQGKLIATHDLSFAKEMCSRVLLLKEGKIVADTGTDILCDEEALFDMGL